MSNAMEKERWEFSNMSFNEPFFSLVSVQESFIFKAIGHSFLLEWWPLDWFRRSAEQ